MNKTSIIFALSVLLLASCQSISFEDTETNNSSTKGSKTMYFKCTGFSMTNMDTDHYDDGESTRATSNNIQNATDHLLLGVYTMDGKLLDTLTYQSKNDPDIPYGTFSRTLEYGKYTILALGWNGSQQCNVHRLDSITFSEGWVPNTFLCRQNIIVNEAYSNTRTLTLKRCIARFILNFKDTNIPQELSEFIINISGAGNTLNSETRYCAQQEDFSRSIPVDIDPANLKKITTYCFLPADSTSVSINIAAIGTQGETITERTFTEVPMKINYSTSYTGNFFPISEFSGSVSFEIDFDGEYNYNF
ncbi:MAG: hypothetical protein IKT87_07165 [Bacteroidaceae bacterium]|nr:hypothetical protein [Bacteroidaceae bacterium]